MKQFIGEVISTKNAKTAIVKVGQRSMHPVYKKIINRTKNFASDTNGIEIKEGDKVVIQETRPISKTKKFKVVEVIK
jgi:small subunit ribosomal protein S17